MLNWQHNIVVSFFNFGFRLGWVANEIGLCQGNMVANLSLLMSKTDLVTLQRGVKLGADCSKFGACLFGITLPRAQTDGHIKFCTELSPNVSCH